MEEITLASNLEIHFVDSSGVISWNFLGDEPDYPFVDWNFSATTAEDYAWLCDCITAEGHDIYVADFTEQGAYSCRILVPGMSEIYPVEDLAWENNSIGNRVRPALVRLQELSDDEARALLDDLQTMNLNDERPLWEILGLAIPVDTAGKELRIGELRTLLALAIGDCSVYARRLRLDPPFPGNEPRTASGLSLYRKPDEAGRCRQLQSFADAAIWRGNPAPGAGAAFVRSERFFGLHQLGADMQGSAMHQTLLKAYDKLFAAAP